MGLRGQFYNDAYPCTVIDAGGLWDHRCYDGVLSQVFIDSGFTAALIQKKEIDDLDCNSVFYVNIIMAILMYMVLFILSPLIANFYRSPEITAFLRVLALLLIIRAFSLVHIVLLNKKMLFGLNCRVSLIASSLSGLLGIGLAYYGMGVWALVWQQLLQAVIITCLQWYWGSWRPHLIFNLHRSLLLFRFGWKLFCSSLLDTVYNELYTILIGRLFSIRTLSFYQQGRMIPIQGVSIVSSTLNTVLFPAFSSLQDKRSEMYLLARKSLQTIAFIFIPMFGLLFIIAEPLVPLLFSEKWTPCVIFWQLSCFIAVFYPFHALNLQIISACGRSDIFLILEIIKKIQVVIIIFLTYNYGVLAMVYGMVFFSPVAFVENSFCNGKFIGYTWWRQAKDMFPFVCVTVIACAACWGCMTLVTHNWQKILLGIPVMLIFYLGLSFVFKIIPQDIYTAYIGKNFFKRGNYAE